MSDQIRVSQRLAVLADDALARWPEQLRLDIERKVCVLEEFRKVCLRIENPEAADLADQTIRAAIADWKSLHMFSDPEQLRALVLANVKEGGQE